MARTWPQRALTTAAMLSGLLALNACRPADPTALAIAGIGLPVPATEIDCASLKRPLVLLVMGQSNAGNHATGADAPGPVFTLHGRHCYASRDPLPGATGRHASLWSTLPAIHARPVLLIPIALESTTIAQWTQPGPLKRYLDGRLKLLEQSPFQVDLILWQQGEADARDGSAVAAYRDGLLALRANLDAHAIHAPLVLARSTYCAGGQHNRARGARQVRAAIDSVSVAPGFAAGPDFDTLQGALRDGSCHFSASGRKAAGAMWAEALAVLAAP
jgi:hypothetical protein